ncbi:MAG TPA: helix-turn-helix domain-containing protein [Ktedonobacterales bacterium]
MEEWLTLEQIAQELQLNIETVRGWVRKRKLVAYRPTRDYRVKRSDLNTFLEKRRSPMQEKK